MAAVKLHRKDNRCSKFFEIGTGAESAYEYETEDDNYRSSLKHRNNWQSTNHQYIWYTSENKMFVLFDSILHYKHTKLCNCCMKKKKF